MVFQDNWSLMTDLSREVLLYYPVGYRCQVAVYVEELQQKDHLMVAATVALIWNQIQSIYCHKYRISTKDTAYVQ